MFGFCFHLSLLVDLFFHCLLVCLVTLSVVVMWDFWAATFSSGATEGVLQMRLTPEESRSVAALSTEALNLGRESCQEQDPDIESK